uniref:Uncharacterized protein n=1 Tax=Arundo donax TaxID=35708 RepID=A0A0A9DTA6_ARUDO
MDHEYKFMGLWTKYLFRNKNESSSFAIQISIVIFSDSSENLNSFLNLFWHLSGIQS